jgi:diketogulonate reductase-like aldo/keto reductase
MLLWALATVAASNRPAHTTLNNGVQMPWINNGAWDLHHVSPSEAEAMEEWLALGGRGLDTAFSYGTKDQIGVGIAVRNSTVPRDDIFITTKIPCTGNTTSALGYVKADLAQLALPYADLILIHTPSGCKTEAEIQATWAGLEMAIAQNLTRAIGV